MRIRDLVVPLLVAAFAGLQGVRTASAEMLILESNVPAYQQGAVIPDGPLPALPLGGRVKVLLLTSMETKIFEGPARASSPRDIGATGAARETGATRGPVDER
jgi:hypothetical protein